MKLTLWLCPAAISLLFSACSGSSSNHDLMGEAGTGPDLGWQETGKDGARTDATSDGVQAKADVHPSDVPPTTSADAGSCDAGTTGTDATVPIADAAVNSDAPTVQPDVGRDSGVSDATLVPTDTAARDTSSPDAATGKIDTFPSSGNATVDRLAVAAALCGPQSVRTAPVGWQTVIVGENGCSMEAPPTWIPYGAGTPTSFVVEDQTRVTGSSVMAGVDLTNTVTCTPHGVVTWMFAKNTDCVGFKELDWKEKTVNVAGLLIPEGDLVYSCTQGGVPVVGFMMVQIEGTSPWCNMLVEAFWTPETQIEARTCTLTQTLNSLRCPQGASGCDDGECRADCTGQGHASGACTSDGTCMCTN